MNFNLNNPERRSGVLTSLATAIVFVGGLATACRTSDDTSFEPVYPECSDLGEGGFSNWQMTDFYGDPTSLAGLAEKIDMTNGIILTNPEYIEWLMGIFEEAGLNLTPQLVKREDCVASDGSFDLAKWKAQINAYRDLDLNRFIENGTWVGVILLDDLGLFADGGPNSATLDEMAKLIKEVFGIPDGQNFSFIVRHDPSDMDGHELQIVNRGYLQITDVKVQDRAGGDLRAFIADEYDAANEIGLGCTIVDLNVSDWAKNNGEDCMDLGRPDGFLPDKCGAKPNEIEEVVKAIREAGCWGTAIWKISEEDSPFLGSEYSDGINGLATACDGEEG